MVITMTRHAAVSDGHWCVISVFGLGGNNDHKVVLQKYSTTNWITGAHALEHEESWSSEAAAAEAFIKAVETDRKRNP